MKIISIDSQLTQSPSRLVLVIDKAPEKSAFESVNYGNLTLNLDGNRLHVSSPAGLQIDRIVLDNLASRITEAEERHTKDVEYKKEKRDRLLNDLSKSLGLPLETSIR
jgi:hypothetical protein